MKSATINGFEHLFVEVNGNPISVHRGGEGPPLLLLHGYPQTHATWNKVAPCFAQEFHCIIPDLRGYGDSAIPASDQNHTAYSKRTMAQELIALMSQLGLRKFGVLGHDRGARVAYRMALDHPDHITKIGIIEVVPTSDMWTFFNAEMAMHAYHWTFLAQPSPLPETMINAAPINYLDWTLRSWTKNGSLKVFDPIALESYREQFRNPSRIHAMCEDYRAGATIDRLLDKKDLAAQKMIEAPLFFVWAQQGFPAQTGDPIGLWSKWARKVNGLAVESGHFAQEENPEAVQNSFIPFFL